MKETRVVYYQYNPIYRVLYVIFAICTAIIGYNIHHRIFFSIINFFLAPLSWIWWLIGEDVNMSIIKQSFDFFLK